MLHWLRHNPEKRAKFVSAFEHCDMVAATLCGITDARRVKRSVCAMGHKWMWNASLGGLPPESFLAKVDPLLAGARAKLDGDVRDLRQDRRTRFRLTGQRSWGCVRASPFLLAPSTPIGMQLAQARKKATSSTSSARRPASSPMRPKAQLIPGVCGVVPGSVHPQFTGIEAGLSATGDIFSAIARRANTTVEEFSKGLTSYRAGQTGLLRMTWDNGDRTVLVNPNLGGMTIGWNLLHTAQDELFAAIEGTAFHTRVILDRMSEYGAPTQRVINGGGIPQNNPVLNQVYANVLARPVLVPSGKVTGVGSAIFAFLAAGIFKTDRRSASERSARRTRCTSRKPRRRDVYVELYELYRKIYFGSARRRKDQQFGRCCRN